MAEQVFVKPQFSILLGRSLQMELPDRMVINLCLFSYFFFFLRNCHTVFHNGCLFYIPTVVKVGSNFFTSHIFQKTHAADR
jgi:hypothetical protein